MVQRVLALSVCATVGSNLLGALQCDSHTSHSLQYHPLSVQQWRLTLHNAHCPRLYLQPVTRNVSSLESAVEEDWWWWMA